MIEYAEEIKIAQLKPVLKKNTSARIKAHGLPVIRKEKTELQKKEKKELDIPLHKWNLPPQPEGYIKSHRFDFF